MGTQFCKIFLLLVSGKQKEEAQFDLTNKDCKAFSLTILQKSHFHRLIDAYFMSKKIYGDKVKCPIFKLKLQS